MTRYIALLRGINVGGKNSIKMAALATCFEQHGFANVATYIQSGNVLFDSPEPATKLVAAIEAMLAKTFSYNASVVLVTAAQLRKIVEAAPKAFGTAPARYRYDVLFLKPPLTAAAALKVIPLKAGVDVAHAGPGVIYHSRLISRATASRLARVVSMPIYHQMTIRNWNTTTKLLALVDASVPTRPASRAAPAAPARRSSRRPPTSRPRTRTGRPARAP